MLKRLRDMYGRWRRLKDLKGRRGPDFAVGDIAVCIDDAPWISYWTGESGRPGPMQGQCCKVTAIDMQHDCHLIKIAGFDCWYVADAFERLDPRSDETEDKEECPQLMDWVREHRKVDA